MVCGSPGAAYVEDATKSLGKQRRYCDVQDLPASCAKNQTTGQLQVSIALIGAKVSLATYV